MEKWLGKWVLIHRHIKKYKTVYRVAISTFQLSWKNVCFPVFVKVYILIFKYFLNQVYFGFKFYKYFKHEKFIYSQIIK